MFASLCSFYYYYYYFYHYHHHHHHSRRRHYYYYYYFYFYHYYYHYHYHNYYISLFNQIEVLHNRSNCLPGTSTAYYEILLASDRGSPPDITEGYALDPPNML